jgi:hypothetical protein
MWCHRYYLRNLCDDRFADWPIVEHIPLLQVSSSCNGLLYLEIFDRMQLTYGTVLSLPQLDNGMGMLSLN